MKAVEICNVSKSFGEKQVLRDINLQVNKGEILGLLGPSGAGKTTLINILTGQMLPTDGKAMVFGKSSETLKGADYKQLGIMMDSFGLYERLNCYDNLHFFTMLNGIGEKKIKEVLLKVGLQKADKTIVANLSKGMRSRLLLARVLLGEPELLFLDEPTSGLDPVTAEEIHKLIMEEKERGVTIFLTTHNMMEATKLCDNVALLCDGKIVEYGNPAEVCRRYNHQKKIKLHLYEGEELVLSHDAEGLARVVQLFEKDKIETIHSTEPDLETVFMELTGRKFA
ncbi:MAG: ABC transporter ATP-binding protein [Lachnospiraceae bacterium]|nr:ABC transporter ATP-binding protein [Lachnospiraceae bacterium]